MGNMEKSCLVSTQLNCATHQNKCNVVLYNNYHLFTETEGNSVFCGPETTQNTLLSQLLSK